MLIESNIIIYALNEKSPKHTAAQEFLTASQNNLVVAQQNIFESLRVLTHTKYPHPFGYQEAIDAITSITQYAEMIHPTYETPEIAYALIQKYQLHGSEIFDGYLVATALSHEGVLLRRAEDRAAEDGW